MNSLLELNRSKMGKHITFFNVYSMVAVNKVLESRKTLKGPGNAFYDVILLDLDMPILDGYGACR
jgi:CheY-like chemotaxis protein